MNTHRAHAPIVRILGILFVPLGACSEGADPSLTTAFPATIDSDSGVDTDGSSPSEVSSQESELNGNIRYSGGGSPFMIAHWERAAKHDRILVRAPAFEQCVRNSMAAPRAADGSQGRPGAPRYLACHPVEPNRDQSISVQTGRVIAALRSFNNDLVTHLNPNGATQAEYQGYGTYDTHTVQAGTGFHESFNAPGVANWDDYTGIEPWNYHAGTFMHEFLHTQNYGHLDAGCAADTCDPVRFPECQWTSVCGGSGTPPSTMNWETVGQAARNYCAWQRLDDETAYMTAGEPSVPYIVSECAGSVFTQSEAQCGGIFDNPACEPGQLRLLTWWNGTTSSQQTSTSCACYADPRHLIALRTLTTGDYLTAWEGGGTNVRTRVSNRIGPWQTFFAIEQSASPWRAHDLVQLKAFNGEWIDSDFRADRTTPLSVTLGLQSQTSSTLLRNGSFVALRSGTLHARDDGNQLVPSSAAVGTNETFAMVEFDRSTIVYLRGAHGFFVNVDSNGALWNQSSDSNLRNLAPAFDRFRMASAFRIIDWNGGALVSGDTVSMEALLGDRWHFVSTPTESGQARLDHSVATRQRFTIRKASGSSGSVIDHDDVVSFRSYNGHYLSAMPSADARQLTNAGTWEGPWQRFTLRMVQHHDMVRPTW